METINTNKGRVGNFTSSEIGVLMSNGKAKGTMGEPAYTYIDECNMERRLLRSITDEVDARPLTWGKFLEKRVFNLLGIIYKECSQESIKHPDFSCWWGSPDGEKFDEGKTVIDIKCPKTLKSFCNLVDCMRDENIVEALRKVKSGSKKIGDIYFWQLVSNAILTGAKYAELIVYMPYKNELDEIRAAAFNYDGAEQKSFLWIYGSSDEELPHLIEEGYYKNINTIRFEVLQEWKDELEERVSLASNELDEYFEKK